MFKLMPPLIPLLLVSWAASASLALASGPDVILGQIVGPNIYASEDDVLAVTAGTTSCNAGDRVLSWHKLPDNQHPVISLNLYRLSGDRFEQIGQSWVKHGFLALQQNICGFGCQPNATGNDGLGVGCSDPYSALNNQGPGLASRGKINPFTGYFDGALSGPDSATPSSPIAHGLQVKKSDIIPKARYFLEGQYITPDDATAGNGNNNVSHTEVWFDRSATGEITVRGPEPGPISTVRETPAVMAWPYAQFSIHDDSPDDGRIYVGYRVTRVSLTNFRYTYVIYNMNSDKGASSVSIPVAGHFLSNIGFSAVNSHEEPWSNDPWSVQADTAKITWSTKTFDQDAIANALRWGTAYTFWFETDANPTEGKLKVGAFKTQSGSSEFSANALVPK